MSDLVTSMKALGAKLTGKKITGNDLVKVVDNITENYEGGGGGGGTIVVKLLGNMPSTEGVQSNMTAQVVDGDWDTLWQATRKFAHVIAVLEVSGNQSVEYFHLVKAYVNSGRKEYVFQRNRTNTYDYFNVKAPQFSGGPVSIEYYKGTLTKS